MMRAWQRRRRNRRRRRFEDDFPEPVHTNSNITPKVDIREMDAITNELLQYRILQFGHNMVKRARKAGKSEVVFEGQSNPDGDGNAPRVVVNIMPDAPPSALTFPRACALASLSIIKDPYVRKVNTRPPELANIFDFGPFQFTRRCCINGARYLGKFIAQEMPSTHPAHIPVVGSHPSYSFNAGDLGEWLAAMVAMDYAKMVSCGALQHHNRYKPGQPLPKDDLPSPLLRFFDCEVVQHKYRRITLDAINYMGWNDETGPLDWDQVMGLSPFKIKFNDVDRGRFKKVLYTSKLND